MPEAVWDEAKRLANLAKHGVDFADVPFMDWDHATILEDKRFDYPEQRFWAFGMLRGRLHLAAYCERRGKIRVISFRKANPREVKRYAGKTQTHDGLGRRHSRNVGGGFCAREAGPQGGAAGGGRNEACPGPA